MFSNAEAFVKTETIFIVRYDCIEAYNLFCEINHLWRYGAMGGLHGFDWTQMASYLSLANIPHSPQAIKDLRIIENAICKSFNKKD